VIIQPLGLPYLN